MAAPHCNADWVIRNCFKQIRSIVSWTGHFRLLSDAKMQPYTRPFAIGTGFGAYNIRMICDVLGGN